VIAGLLLAIVLLRPRPPVIAAPPPVPKLATTIDVSSPPTTTTAVVIEQANKPATTVKTADDHYNEGLALLVARQPFRAREAFRSAVELDENHARSHFRLGEMALFGSDFAVARRELVAALANKDQLDERERKLGELGLAVLDRDRPRADGLVKELEGINAADPDLARFRGLLR
jgi:hypothetical protein